MLLLGHHVLLREAWGHLLAGVGQVGLRCWLRGRGDLWVNSLRGHLDLRRCWHSAGHHLRVLLGYVALWSLVALGDLRPRLVTVLLMWLHLTRVRLLVLGGNTRLRRHVPMWVSLLSLRARKGSWTRLIPLRHWLHMGLGELLLWLFG